MQDFYPTQLTNLGGLTMDKLYPGIGIIGNEKLSGIYGMNEGIIDAKGTGIQHLFCDAFDIDLVHSACTLVKIGETIYYGNRLETKGGHQIHLVPDESNAENGFMMTDRFSDGRIQQTNKTCSYDENKIVLDFDLLNTWGCDLDIEIYTYLVLRNDRPIHAKIVGSHVIAKIGNQFIGIKAGDQDTAYLVEESPTGFLYRTSNAVLYNEKESLDLETENMMGVLIGHKRQLKEKEAINFTWGMVFDDQEMTVEHQLDALDLNNYKADAQRYWSNYLERGNVIEKTEHAHMVKVNQIAIKAAMIKGFVPADLTGHYFSEGLPSYYARDSMMIARAFILSGHLKEAREVMLYLSDRQRKTSGEFYQRYNGRGEPSEGANNSVFHQLDSIGYFMKNVRDYYKLTGELLVSQEEMQLLMDVLLKCQKKKGMVGPEGGVNEGVYGPAFITSSNMFIYGGIKSTIELIEDTDYKDRLTQLNQGILAGIETTYLKDEGYMYGYVTYHDDLVKKYDTPVYFGVLYGFENTENMKETHGYLMKNAAYFGEGIGYSEQEYHHGPWLFNTAACGEYAYLNKDMKSYEDKYKWIVAHSNNYGLLPEAVSADNENLPFINPLIWACGEFVSLSFISNQLK